MNRKEQYQRASGRGNKDRKGFKADLEQLEDSVNSILKTTATDSKTYKTKFYNLGAIISVGYRINSSKATQFPIWSTSRLKELIIKGSVMDDDRLKNGRLLGRDYFRELQNRVQQVLGVTGLEDLAQRSFHQLSGGQQQRLILAAALLWNLPSWCG